MRTQEKLPIRSGNVFVLVLLLLATCRVVAQSPPSASESAAYEGLFQAAHTGDLAAVEERIAAGEDLESTDSSGRTPLHIAALASHDAVVVALARAGADMNALDHQDYDIVTIAAVANDLGMLDTALEHGASPSNITSPYRGTALIAAAHLGHHEVVRRLIDAGAPLDHVNNLNWTALMESVVLGDGGPDHVLSARLLVDAGADRQITDEYGQTALDMARERGYLELIEVLED